MIEGLQVPEDIDAIVHCAGLAHQPFGTAKEEFIKTNVDATAKLAMKAREIGVKRFVLISSVSVYGNMGYGVVKSELDDVGPITDYAKSKLEGETVCRTALSDSGTDLVILRLATVIGEGDKANMFRLIEMIDSNRFLMIGNGRNVKSFVHISDVAAAVCSVLEFSGKLDGIYNVTARSLSVKGVVAAIYDELEKPVPRFHLPRGLIQQVLRIAFLVLRAEKLATLEESVRKWCRNGAYSGRKLGDVARISVSATEAIRREVRWFKSRK
jgi:nucleoside-diphosphate-sugar epimerase